MRAKEGLGCSQFEAAAFTELVKEVFLPWLSQSEAVQAGHLHWMPAAQPSVSHHDRTFTGKQTTVFMAHQ